MYRKGFLELTYYVMDIKIITLFCVDFGENKREIFWANLPLKFLECD